MILDHINRIKTNISIHSSKKTTNLLEGTYRSVYKGKGLNFENLREYVINDDVKDIDWKSSARSGTLLVKQFIAEKKHNILVVLDSGIKMNADTDKLENKKELASIVAGTIGYLAIKNGDYIGFSYYNKKGNVEYKPFKDDLYNLEEYLCDYEANSYNQDDRNMNDLLQYIFKNISKRMIIFVITDLSGIDSIQTKVIKQLNGLHDVLFVNINDNYMFGKDLYEVHNRKYIPSFFSNDQKLYELEKETRKKLLKDNCDRFKRNKISMVSISSKSEINDMTVKLLEEHKYANYS